MNAHQWLEKGAFITVKGHQTFVIDTVSANNSNKPVLCILHGFPTSSYDYWKVLDELSIHYRVIIHDHLGFGYSDKPRNYSYTLMDQTTMAQAVWAHLGISSATVLAHDYGTSVLTELLARDSESDKVSNKESNNGSSFNIKKIILCNGSMHIELAHLLLMQKLLRNKFVGPVIARLSNFNLMKKNLRKIFVDGKKLGDEELKSIWAMMEHNNGKAVIAPISRYSIERKIHWNRWIGALQTTQIPMTIVWPDSDPICGKDMAQVISEETQNSQLTWLKDTGHFPMLESPKEWLTAVIE